MNPKKEQIKRTLAGLLAFAAPTLGQDCAGWVERLPTHPPVGSGCVMAFDAARSVAVLFNANQIDTWEWDGADWALRSMVGPEARSKSAMAYDSKRAVTVLYGGETAFGFEWDTWEWDGQVWTRRNLPSAEERSGHAMVYDDARGVVLMFGGYGGLDDHDNGIYLGDTLEWDGVGNWKQVSNTGPSARTLHTMAYDEARQVAVLYGGVGANQAFADTWEWDGQAWTQRDVHGPPPLFGAAMVYDSALHACVLFGGHIGTEGPDLSNQTWAWDGQAWSEFDTPKAPAYRLYHGMAYDSTRSAIVLFGGRFTNGNALEDTWEFNCTPPPCYPDLDGNGVLDLFDFLSFVNAFNAGDTGPADCDHNQSLDLFDFLCYTNAFNTGC